MGRKLAHCMTKNMRMTSFNSDRHPDVPQRVEDAKRAEELPRVLAAAPGIKGERDGVHRGPEAHADRTARSNDGKHEPARAEYHKHIDERVGCDGRAREAQVELGRIVGVARGACVASTAGARAGRRAVFSRWAERLVWLGGELYRFGLEVSDDDYRGCK